MESVKAKIPKRVDAAGARARARQKGSEIIEFALVCLPMFGFLFVLLNIAWAVFARATLQNAVREGVRYAVTGQVITGYGHKDSIRKVVQQNGLFLLRGTAGWNTIQVHFYTPDTLTDVSNVQGGNVGGNLVRVSVENFSQVQLMPTLHMKGLASDLAPIVMAARSWDRMEASPPTGAPAL
jgi:hypothetical protein